MRALALLLALGCTPTRALPSVVSIHASATPAQAAVITDALDHWCDSAGWCPRVGLWGADIIVDHDFARHDVSSNNVAAFQRGGVSGKVFLDGENPLISERLDWLWIIAAHELGHFGVEGHTPVGTGSVMSTARNEDAPSDLCLDRASVEAFCDESGQCKRRAPTCDFPEG